MVVRLSWFRGRTLVAQARGVLGSTTGDCQPFHFPLKANSVGTAKSLETLGTANLPNPTFYVVDE